jgi:hypothetical protein
VADPRSLLAVSGSADLLLLVADADAAYRARYAWEQANLTVRRVRGRKMRIVDGLFDEFAAALQFPSYFGENWAAFDECLSDMDDWMPLAAGVVLLVEDPTAVLADEPEVELEVLVRCFRTATETYAAPIERGEWWDRPTVPFHVVLHSQPADAEETSRRWTRAGAQVIPFP